MNLKKLNTIGGVEVSSLNFEISFSSFKMRKDHNGSVAFRNESFYKT